MSTKTISGTHNNAIVLSNYPGYTQFILNATITAGSNVGVYGDKTQSWTVTNAGFVAGYDGMFFSAAGTPSTVGNTGTIDGTATNGTGILLESGGSVSNQGVVAAAANAIWIQGGSGTVVNFGRIEGTTGNAVVLKGGGTVANSGTIAAPGGDGVYLTAGLVTNGTIGATTALITGYSGVATAATAAPSSVVNYGTIAASGTIEAGVLLQSGGSVGNHGLIEGGANGVWIGGGSGMVSNSGAIEGVADGVVLKAGGTVANSGTITAPAGDGVYLTAGLATNGSGGATTALIAGYSGVVTAATAGASTILNYGTIAASGTNEAGVLLQSGGSVSNHGLIEGGANGIWIDGGTGAVSNSGTIEGTSGSGVELASGGTLVNSGTIVGDGGDAAFLEGGNSLLVIDPQSRFVGNVYGGTAGSTIELGTGAGVGTIALGTQFTGFSGVEVDKGAVWQVSEAGATALTLTNDGTIIVPDGGLLALASDSTGSTGTIELGPRSTVEEEGPVAAGETASFLDSTGTLLLDSPGEFSGTIDGFQAGDGLDLVDTPATSLVYSGSGSAGTLTVMNGDTAVASLALSGGTDYSQSAFALSEPGGNVSEITFASSTPQGLTFNLSYDSSIASAPAGFLGVFNQGIQFFEQTFINPITINLEVGWGEIAGTTLSPGVDEGGWEDGGVYTYSQVKTALANNAQSAAQQTAVANLPATDPTDGGSFFIPGAEEKALGLIGPDTSGIDGAVGFQGDIATAAYALGGVEHELTHAIGRIDLSVDGSSDYSILGLFRYTAPGVLNPAATTGAYFSIDSGNTEINTFSTGAGLPADAADYSDWSGATPDSFNNSYDNAGPEPFSAGDLTEMNVLGYDTACYCRGTLILTERGEVPIEELAIGDRVVTLSGAARPIRWIGRRTVARRFADPLRALPIRISAGALGDDVPRRDLCLSADHALLIDGVLIQAGGLVNGCSIVRERNVPETFTYYHLELAEHDLILAEGTPAETFVDNVDRMGFDNWDKHRSICGEAEGIVEMAIPRAKAHRQVPLATRARLAQRAALLRLVAAA